MGNGIPVQKQEPRQVRLNEWPGQFQRSFEPDYSVSGGENSKDHPLRAGREAHTLTSEDGEWVLDELVKTSRLLTVSELAGLLSIVEKTVYSYVSRGMIPESNIRFRPRAIAKWLAAREFSPREFE